MPSIAEPREQERSLSKRTPTPWTEATSTFIYGPEVTVHDEVESPPRELPGRETRWREVGASRVSAAESIRKLLGRFYSLRNPGEVTRFVNKNGLLLWLLRMRSEIREHFGARKVYLEVVSDPEVEDVRLVAFIITDSSPDKAIDQLRQFDEHWWPYTPGWVEEKLTVTVEFE